MIILFILLCIIQRRIYFWTQHNNIRTQHITHDTGSDLPKQEEQLGEGVVHLFPWNFSQNGLVAYKNGTLLEIQTISKHLGEENVKRIINWTLKYLSNIDLPIKVSYYLYEPKQRIATTSNFLFHFLFF